MIHLIIVLVAIFVVTNIYTEYMRRKTDNPLVQPMSAYLTGPYGWVQSVGFACMAAAIALLGVAIKGSPHVWYLPLGIGALALIMVVATKWAQLDAHGWEYTALEKLHLFCAGVAFLCVTFAEIHYPITTRFEVLPKIAVLIAVLFALMKGTQTAILEKVYTALIVSWFACLFL